jgi:3-phenylpropionate/cinnamic acid dioxygenase small subunit
MELAGVMHSRQFLLTQFRPVDFRDLDSYFELFENKSRFVAKCHSRLYHVATFPVAEIS